MLISIMKNGGLFEQETNSIVITFVMLAGRSTSSEFPFKIIVPVDASISRYEGAESPKSTANQTQGLYRKGLPHLVSPFDGIYHIR